MALLEAGGKATRARVRCFRGRADDADRGA